MGVSSLAPVVAVVCVFTNDTYDGASRIKTGLYASDNTVENYSLNNVNYDFNGNITNLSRNGWKSNNTFGLIDNLNYTYNSNSNKILKVDDASNDIASFKDAAGATDYTYYLDGSLKSDANKGITLIEYNYLKRPKSLFWNHILLIIKEMNAICTIASDESIVFSTSRNNLRLKFNHPKDLSTCHRHFCGINPFAFVGVPLGCRCWSFLQQHLRKQKLEQSSSQIYLSKIGRFGFLFQAKPLQFNDLLRHQRQRINDGRTP